MIRSYNGKLFRAQAHIRRLNYGAAHLNLTQQDFSHLAGVAADLIDKNRIQGDATVYIQVTRGAAPRGHAFPDPVPAPTVYAAASAFNPEASLKNQENGISVILVPDQRWARCDMKTVGLTANILANQQAKEKGAKEALFVRDGVILEGTHSNFMVVKDDCLITAPASNYILHGITRELILELAVQEGIQVCQAPVYVSELNGFSEAFITGTTTEVTPVTTIDGRAVGTGSIGPVTRAIQAAFRRKVEI